jgi:hypothetical protein
VKKQSSIFRADRFDSALRCGSRNAGKNAPARTSRSTVRNGGSAPSFTVRNIPANIPANISPARRFSARFTLPRQHQRLVLSMPEIRRHLLWQQRLVLVRVALAMLDNGFCSLNAAARMLGVPASSLCVLLQNFRTAGERGLMPKFSTARAATACRISFHLKP